MLLLLLLLGSFKCPTVWLPHTHAHTLFVCTCHIAKNHGPHFFLNQQRLRQQHQFAYLFVYCMQSRPAAADATRAICDPMPSTPLFPPSSSLPACLPACSSLPYPLLMVFLLSLITPCISVSACMSVTVHVCVCVSVCECFYAMLIYFNSYLMSNVKAHGKREQKKKALKTVAYICAMATARVANHSQCACASVLWYL